LPSPEASRYGHEVSPLRHTRAERSEKYVALRDECETGICVLTVFFTPVPRRGLSRPFAGFLLIRQNVRVIYKSIAGRKGNICWPTLNVSHGHSTLPGLFMRAYCRHRLRTLQRTACCPPIGSRFIEDEHVFFSSQRPHTPGFYSSCGGTRLYPDVASICRPLAWRLLCCIAKSTDACIPCLVVG